MHDVPRYLAQASQPVSHPAALSKEELRRGHRRPSRDISFLASAPISSQSTDPDHAGRKQDRPTRTNRLTCRSDRQIQENVSDDRTQTILECSSANSRIGKAIHFLTPVQPSPGGARF